MRAANHASTARMGLTESLSFKTVTLFSVVFLATFAAMSIYGFAEYYFERGAAEQSIAAKPASIAIDPKIKTDLAEVLSLDSAPLPPDVSNPFNDRTGISGLTRTPPSPQTAAIGGPGNAGLNYLPAGGLPTTSSATPGRVNDGTSPTEPELSATDATKKRYDAWLERVRYGLGDELDPTVFAIDDLMPVGIVDGGTEQQEVMFFSKAANKTVSFPVGTRFYDGWLIELRPEGVIFSLSDKERTTRFHSWEREIKAGG